MTLAADIALMHRLADAAREAIAPWFRRIADVERKADLSPVTIADTNAEAAMRAILERDRPGDGIIGEEFAARRSQSGRVWVLDPIDGTRGFIAGRPLYGTLIGLVEDGYPVLGMIDAGAAGDRWLGRLGGEAGTTLNGRPVRTRSCEMLASAHGATTAAQLFSAAGHAAFQRIGNAAGDILFGGDCHNYGLLAAGHLDFVMEEGLKIHDWAALVPIITAAGGIITDWRGRPLSLHTAGDGGGQIFAAGDPRVHAEALSRI